MTPTKADQMQERLIEFGAMIIQLCRELPRSYAGQHFATQLLRSGTSPAPNYGEARSGESRADFIHKMGLAQKELNETQVWRQMLERAELLPGTEIARTVDECRQLARMLNASIQTARRNQKCQMDAVK